MIFVTVGTTELPFDRLLRKMDELAPILGEEVIMQTGASDFTGVNTKCQKFMDSEEMSANYERCSVLVCHAGVGTLMNGMSRCKPVVAVPRKTRFGEVDTDHQHMIAEELVNRGRGFSVDDIEDLGDYIERARTMVLEPYEKNTELSDFIAGLLADVESKLKR